MTVIKIEDYISKNVEEEYEPMYTCGIDYLIDCKKNLEEQDYRDVLCGIMDPFIWETLDIDLQTIVAAYFKICSETEF